MKRMISRTAGILAAVMMLAGSLTMLPAGAEETQSAPRIMGDMNGDRRVTMEDAKKALDISVMSNIGLVDKETTEETNPGDINMNGTIEIMDALAIMRYFCQTLVGEQPLWSDIRKVTYHDGSDYDLYYMFRKPGEEAPEQMPFEKRGMYVEIGCAEGAPGETVTVPVYIAGTKKLSRVDYAHFVPEGLCVMKIESGLGFRSERIIDAETGLPGKWENSSDTPGGELGASVVNDTLGLCGFSWISINGRELDVRDGMILVNFSYQIPEDAKTGDIYVLTADTKKVIFNEEPEDVQTTSGIQYTMLDGVIAVK
jgi:hypothetical protein